MWNFPENTEQIMQQVALFSFLFNSIQNPPANEGDLGSIPGSGRSPGEWNGVTKEWDTT